MYNLCTPTPIPIALDLPENSFSALQHSLTSESDLRERKELKSTELLILLKLNSILLNLHSFIVSAGDIDDLHNKWQSFLSLVIFN